MRHLRLSTASRLAAEQVYADINCRIIRHNSSWDFSLGKSQVAKLREFLQANRTQLGNAYFGFRLDQCDNQNSPPLTAELIIRECNGGVPLFHIDRNLKVMRISLISGVGGVDPTGTDFSEASTTSVIAEREGASFVRFYADGYNVGSLDPSAPQVRPGRPNRFARAADDYEAAIFDHYENEVKFCQSSNHWEDKARRILRASNGSASGTEDIFHQSLFNWLQRNITSAHIYSKPRQPTNDEWDISIATSSGRAYLIEIKWLGENSHATKYDLTRLAKGIRQVNEYLRRELNLTRASLIAYDGRTLTEFALVDNEIDATPDGCRAFMMAQGEALDQKAIGYLLYLESTTGSQA